MRNIAIVLIMITYIGIVVFSEINKHDKAVQEGKKQAQEQVQKEVQVPIQNKNINPSAPVNIVVTLPRNDMFRSSSASSSGGTIVPIATTPVASPPVPPTPPLPPAPNVPPDLPYVCKLAYIRAVCTNANRS